MSITPVDFRNQKFGKKLRGYDPFFVDAIVNEAASELERLIDANTELQRQVRILEERLRGYNDIETSLKETLLTAQQAAEEKRRVAERASEVTLKETELVCAELRAEQMRELDKIKGEIESLRLQKVRFAAELRALLDTHARMIEEHSADSSFEDTLTTVSPASGEIPVNA